MGRGHFTFRILCVVLMVLCAVTGVILIVGFFRALILPSENVGAPLIPANYWGFYMAAFAGILLITWAGFLLLALRDPVLARGIGFVTAIGLILNSLLRLVAWASGEFAEVGNVPRVEAAIMLLIALMLIWTTPAREAKPA
jgi:hypothetical protein